MRENKDNADRMRMCADLLVILLSSGEPIPITHYGKSREREKSRKYFNH